MMLKEIFERFSELRDLPTPTTLDDWGPDGENSSLISEAGFARLLSRYRDSDFAMITAYRSEFNKKQNIRRNRDLRHEFNKREMGVYQVVGHWQECQIDGVEYKDCPKDRLKDVIERSYMVIKPDSMTPATFELLIGRLTKKFNQDGSLIRVGGGAVQVIEKNGNKFPIGTKMTLGKIAQAYSQHVKKMSVPFVFEGVEVPGTIMGRRLFQECGISYPLIEEGDILNDFDSFVG